MKTYVNPPVEQWEELLTRPSTENPQVRGQVLEIIEKVKQEGDRALREYSERFDRVSINELRVSKAEIAQAITEVSEQLKEAIAVAVANIRKFHEMQVVGEMKCSPIEGVECRIKSVPIGKVGLYVPGGSAPLFSTVLMLAIPASIARCREVVLCTPVGRDGRVAAAVLYAAELCGVKKIFKVGGAQAIAAMAYGTESIPRVDKIFGPGNQYVTQAKQLVSLDRVAIDMPAGPSEVLVMADSAANPSFIAADLLSQAEHGADSQVVLVTDCSDLVPRVEQELRKQLLMLPRETIASAALENSRIFVFDNQVKMVDIVNHYAPEHLIISMDDADEIAEKIDSAGSIFIGAYTPESVGDNASGTNHTLPTGGWAASYSGVSLDSFQKKIMYQKLTPEGLQRIGPVVETMAQAEGLDAHKQAVSIRLAEIGVAE